MKRFGFLALLMLLVPPAHAGDGISFSIGGRRIHIEASRYCRSTSCASVSVSGNSDWRRKDDGDFGDNDRGLNAPAPVAAVAPAIAAAPAVPAAVSVPPAQPVAAAAPPVHKPAAVALQPVAAPPAPPPIRPAVMAPSPPPVPRPAFVPAEPLRSAPAVPAVSRVSREAEDEVADIPIGDWQTEGKGIVRIVKCGRALCGYVLNAASDDKGEAVLVNMKPKTEVQWTGNVYSHDSGDTYYGTMAMQGANTLRVEACALGRFYCSGNNWTRIGGRAGALITSRQTSSEPRS